MCDIAGAPSVTQHPQNCIDRWQLLYVPSTGIGHLLDGRIGPRRDQRTPQRPPRPLRAGRALLRDLDIDRLWAAAKETDKRALVDELIEAVIVHDDRLQVSIHGAPPLNVAF